MHLGAIGELLWDIYPNEMYLGGSPGIFIHHVHALGHRGFLCSRVGADLNGNELKQKLKLQNIQTTYIQIDPINPTATVTVRLNHNGAPQYQCSSNTAFDHLDELSSHEVNKLNLDAILFTSMGQRNITSRKAIQKMILARPADKIVFVANIRGVDNCSKEIIEFGLDNANIIQCNETELELISSILENPSKNSVEFCQLLIDQYAIEILVLTLGQHGAVAFTKDNITYVPGIKVEVVDVSGAGDAMIASFILDYLKKKSIKECLHNSIQLAALVVTKKGAAPKYQVNELQILGSKFPEENLDPKFERYLIAE